VRRGVWAALALSVLVTGCVRPDGADRPDGRERYTMESRAMEPTLVNGQPVTGRPVSGAYEPRRGDVVVIRPPDSWRTAEGRTTEVVGDLVIRRVIGLGGDTLSCCDVHGRIYLGSSPLDEPYVTENAALTDRGCRRRSFAPVAVPGGQLFVLGDRRATAADSRCLGAIPVASVVAVVDR
jgi:signal peptidase I